MARSQQARAALGRTGERLAAAYLEQVGMVVVDRNWRFSHDDLRGELDLVAWDGPTLVIIEVKARRGTAAGGPLVAVTPRKLVQLRRLAGAWLAAHPVRAADVRLDVVGVTWPLRGGDPTVDHVVGVG